MADYQYIVDQIRAFIAATDQTKTPQVVEWASAYAALVTDANARLRRCTDYLRKGLRTEAIHLADEHPLVLDVVAALDLPEASEWEATCAMYELARPPLLLIDAAQELNEAYATAQPMEALLERHRRLALDRAPLADRIAVMRGLARVDTASAFWEDDLRVFETARLKELKNEVVRAVAAKDQAALTRLMTEITSAEWRVQTPSDLRTTIQRTELSGRQDEHARLIRQALPDVDVAYQAQDLGAVTKLVSKVGMLAEEAEMTLPPDVESHLAPVWKWIDKQNALARQKRDLADACQQLSAAIDRGAPASELESLGAKAAPLGAVPDDLTRRVRQAIKAEADRVKKRKMVRAASVAAAMLGVALVAGLIVRQMMFKSRADEIYAKLSGYVEAGTPDDLKKADRYVSEVAASTPAALERSDIKKLTDDLEAKKAADKERAAEHAENLAAAKNAVEISLKKNSSDAADWKDADRALDKAAGTARSAAEKTAVADLRDSVTRAREKFRSGTEEKLRKEIAAIKERVTAFDSAVAKATASDKAAATLLDDLTRAKATADGAGLASLSRDAATLFDQVTRSRNKLAMKDQEAEALAAVKSAATSPTALARALRTFIEQCPNSDHAARFKKALALAPAWDGVTDAAALWTAWGRTLRAGSADVAKRQADITEYFKKNPEGPWAPAYKDYAEYLAIGQRVVADDGPWKNKDLRPTLTLPKLRTVSCVKASNGKQYYLPPGMQPQNDAFGVSFKYMTAISYLAVEDPKLLKTISLKTDQVSGAAHRIPQAALATEIDKMADALDADWETFGFDLVLKIADAKEVDPVLRLLLAKRALKLAINVPWGGEKALQTVGTSWEMFDTDNVNWMDPDDPDVAASRTDAAEKLTRAADLKKGRDAVVKKRDELAARLKLVVLGQGVLLKDRSDWTIAATMKAEAGKKVFAVTPTRGWYEIGAAQDGRYVPDGRVLDREGDAMDGSLVFIVDP